MIGERDVECVPFVLRMITKNLGSDFFINLLFDGTKSRSPIGEFPRANEKWNNRIPKDRKEFSVWWPFFRDGAAGYISGAHNKSAAVFYFFNKFNNVFGLVREVGVHRDYKVGFKLVETFLHASKIGVTQTFFFASLEKQDFLFVLGVFLNLFGCTVWRIVVHN